MTQFMFFVPYAVAIALYAADAAGRLPRRTFPIPRLSSWVWVAVIVVTYGLQLGAVGYGATHGDAYPAWRVHLPLPVLDLGSDRVDVLAAVVLVTGLIQTIALVALYTSGCTRASLTAGVTILLAMSLASPVLSSADVYSNVGYALLGARAYAPPAHPFGGQFWPIDAWWGTPMVPAPYGPLWIAIVAVVTGGVPTLLGKILALRALGAVSVAALIAALRALHVPRRVLLVVVLNPAIAMQFVANAHNDAFAIALLAWSAFVIRRGPLPAAVLVAAAGLVKLPYAVLSLPVFMAVNPMPRRIAYCALSILIAVAISAWLGGAAYLGSLEYHVRVATNYGAWHVVAEAVAVLILAGAMLGFRRLRAGVWLIPQIGALHPAFIYPWYGMWSFPYALGRRRVLAYLLLWFPYFTALTNQHLMRVWTLLIVFPMTALLALLPMHPTRAARRRTGPQ